MKVKNNPRVLFRGLFFMLAATSHQTLMSHRDSLYNEVVFKQFYTIPATVFGMI